MSLAVLVPTAAHAATSSPVDAEGEDLGIRVRVEVREIDRSSSWDRRTRTGLRFFATLRPDNGAPVRFAGHPSSFTWRWSGDVDCSNDVGPEMLPKLT